MFSMKSIKKRILGFSNSEKGFTLIEIIAVLVILGILAAVAIPKYTSLQKNARDLSAQAAIAEMQARANTAFAAKVAEWAMDTTNDVSAITFSDLNVEGLSGDYVANFGSAGLISVTSVQGTTVDITRQWNVPIF